MVRVLKILAPISLISLLALAGCTDSNGAAQTSGGSGALERANDNSAVPVVVSKAGAELISGGITRHRYGPGI